MHSSAPSMSINRQKENIQQGMALPFSADKLKGRYEQG